MMSCAALKYRTEMESAADRCWREKATPTSIVGDTLILAVALLALAFS